MRPGSGHFEKLALRRKSELVVEGERGDARIAPDPSSAVCAGMAFAGLKERIADPLPPIFFQDRDTSKTPRVLDVIAVRRLSIDGSHADESFVIPSPEMPRRKGVIARKLHLLQSLFWTKNHLSERPGIRSHERRYSHERSLPLRREYPCFSRDETACHG
jgi:hypothetical protein